MHDSLQDILLWHHTLKILDQIVGIIDLLVLEIVDDQVEPGLWNHINQGWEHLESVFTASEDD